MGRLQNHVRNKLVAGAFAAIPVAVTAFVFWYIDSKARALIGIRYPIIGQYPLVGLLITLGALYVLGLFVTSLVGRWMLHGTDVLLAHIPGLRDLYRSWKQMAFSAEGDEGIFAEVVLIPDETGRMRMIGFTTRRALDTDPGTRCVFVPGSPNPTSGRLLFVPAAECLAVDVPVRVAVKMLISGGNYVPPEIGQRLAAHVGSAPATGHPEKQ